ncbi:PhzF family phenazine biosynthesis protein [Benzoatithermus flavus]|uniref:PhzF family phenazine biosynthesis protein n=1 Tax=Benzoatithermus flavus TaxID=3108223 RepID=A0ABU8XXF4_9PROT
MRYRFVTCDVFTDRPFGGNQLAVLPDAEGLDTARMQAIAAEFNYSETTFVLPPEDPAHLARVRIFTPRAELPFAGHPTVGTALVLAWAGRTPSNGSFVLEEGAGPVPVTIGLLDEAPASAEFAAPAPPEHGEPLAATPLATALGLGESEIVAAHGLPCIASCGTPFLLAELASLDALARARLGAGSDLPEIAATGLFLFTRVTGDATVDLRARMFAPAHGIPEDPATGSAAAALAGFLAGRPDLPEGWHAWRIAQGVEMGRPSLIEARVRRQGGRVAEVRIGGRAVPVMEGTIEVGR